MGSDEQRDREKRVRRSGGAKSEVKRRGLVRCEERSGSSCAGEHEEWRAGCHVLLGSRRTRLRTQFSGKQLDPFVPRERALSRRKKFLPSLSLTAS